MGNSLRFTKMQGLGNDFLLVYGQVPEEVSSLCAGLCDRHFGVGADGVIFLSLSSEADARMRIFNADGSEAKMCGNGIRCVGKYLYDKGLVRREQMTIETVCGVKELTLRIEGGQVKSVTVDMGQAELLSAELPLPAGLNEGMLVSVGNPHAVSFVELVEGIPLSLWGPAVEKSVPGGVNAEFVQVLSPARLRMRVWERGCGVTMACGTGACASAFAAVKKGYCSADRPIQVQLDGGSLFITVNKDGAIRMEGPAVTVFEGEIDS